jgi:hypothetical protein
MKLNPGFLFALSVFLLACQISSADDSSAFERLKTLTGNWEGTYKWTGARSDEGKMNVTYSLTGHGTTVIENLGDENDPSMTTAYHMDNGVLRMTHFCGVGNQPRLKATSYDPEKGVINFEFVDATNLPTPDAPHVNGLRLMFVGKDAIQLQFAFVAKGKESLETIDLHRVP